MSVRAIIIVFTIALLSLASQSLFAQQNQDSLIVKDSALIISTKNVKDSSTKALLAQDTSISKRFDPRKAALRSAIIPGWGQAYNKKYWKIPIVYGALGVTTGVFFYNIGTYNKLRQAVIYKIDTIPGNDALIDPRFQGLSPESLKSYRNAVRQDVDYSVLVFLLFWGLNVVDATVDAHLKAFDVSPDITMKIKPSFNYTTNGAGISLVFSFKDKKVRNLVPLP